MVAIISLHDLLCEEIAVEFGARTVQSSTLEAPTVLLLFLVVLLVQVVAGVVVALVGLLVIFKYNFFFFSPCFHFTHFPRAGTNICA